MNVDIQKVKDEVRQITLRLGKKEILAVGLFGSLTRGD
jgi:predicted nucleotidyltransferase